jgi:8-oxo-dGTP diphosphatase
MSCGAKCVDIEESGRVRRACRVCVRVSYRNPFPGVAVLVVDGDRFLLARRSKGTYHSGKWNLPAGHIEFDEDFLTAGRREVLEETGIEVVVESLISVCSNFLNLPFVVPVLLARPTGGTLAASEDSDEARWFSRGESLPHMAFEADPHIIERYYSTRLSGVPVDPRFAAGLLNLADDPNMAKQIFRAYEGPAGEDPARFCQACGLVCTEIVESGRVRRVCSACGRIHYRNPAAAVSVIVRDGDRILLGLRSDNAFKGGKWCIPGGYMEFDEDFLTTGRREVYEETGLEVEVTSLLSVASNFHTPSTHTLSVALLARPTGGTLRAGDDIQDVAWHPITKTLPAMAFEHHEHLVQRYLATQFVGAPVDPEYARRRLSFDGVSRS